MAANILIKEFIKDFEVGAIAPTSNNLAKKVIEKLTFEKEAIIIEYGPGDGVITKMLLDKMTTNSSRQQRRQRSSLHQGPWWYQEKICFTGR